VKRVNQKPPQETLDLNPRAKEQKLAGVQGVVHRVHSDWPLQKDSQSRFIEEQGENNITYPAAKYLDCLFEKSGIEQSHPHCRPS
jgi:hypothetical protein